MTVAPSLCDVLWNHEMLDKEIMTLFWSDQIFSVCVLTVGSILKNPFLVYRDVQTAFWFLWELQEVESEQLGLSLASQQEAHAASYCITQHRVRNKGLHEFLKSVFKPILALRRSFPPFFPTFFILSSGFLCPYARFNDLWSSVCPSVWTNASMR